MAKRTNNEAWTRDLAILECGRRGWVWGDPTFFGYKRRNQPFPRRYDFLGCVDLLAIKVAEFGLGDPGVDLYLIQFTSRPNHAARRTKMQENLELRRWIDEGATALLWSFDDKGKLKEEVLE